MRKWPVVVLAVGFLVGGFSATALAQPGRAVTVEAVTLKPTTLVESVHTIGNFVANEAVTIRPEVDGRIVEIAFEEGQPVKKGALLFRLDDAIYRAQLREATVHLELSKRNYERARKLNKKGFSSSENLDKTFSEMQVDEATVALNKAQLDKLRIVAPFNGTIGLRNVSLGAFVESKRDLATLVSLDPIKFEFRVTARYYRFIKEGGKIRIHPDALPGEVFDGSIYAIAPTIDINGRSISVKARVSNPGRRLRPGMFGRVSLLVENRERALVVPESAIVQRGDKQYVYRIDNGTANLAEVTLGLRQTGKVEIISGLSAGDSVVTAGQVKLRPGAKVKIATFSDAGDGTR